MKKLSNVTINLGGETRGYHNLFTQAGLDWLLAMINAEAPPPLTYIAVGDNGRETTLGDTQLGNELLRKPISNRERDLGSVIVEAFWDKDEGNFSWKEAGLFAGGTSDPDTGILIARVNVKEEKDARRTATISWEIGIQNA